MNLTLLAPEIQEELLFLPGAEVASPRVTLRQLQRIAATIDWRDQRQLWAALCGRIDSIP